MKHVVTEHQLVEFLQRLGAVPVREDLEQIVLNAKAPQGMTVEWYARTGAETAGQWEQKGALAFYAVWHELEETFGPLPYYQSWSVIMRAPFDCAVKMAGIRLWQIATGTPESSDNNTVPPSLTERVRALIAAADELAREKLLKEDQAVNDPALKGGACRCLFRSRPRVRLVDSSPTSNVARSDGVGRPSEATPDTPKGGLIRTITLIDQPTGRTGPRSIAGINQDDRYPDPFCLILDKYPQLIKRPTMLATPLSLFNRHPVANPLEVFQGNSAPRVLGFRHQLFGDAMVFICRKALFLAAAFLQETFSRFRAFFLQALAQFGMALAQAVDVASRVSLTVRIGGNVHNAQIGPQPGIGLKRRGIGDIDHNGQIELAVPINQIGLAAHPSQALGLIRTHRHRHQNAPIQSQNGYAIQSFPRQQAIIVNDGSMRAKSGLNRLVPFVRFDDFADGSHCHLRRQAKTFTHFAIHQVMQLYLTGSMFAKSCDRNSITGRIEAFHRGQQRGGLIGIRLEFDGQCQLHKYSIDHWCPYVKSKGGSGAPPRPEGRSFRAVTIR